MSARSTPLQCQEFQVRRSAASGSLVTSGCHMVMLPRKFRPVSSGSAAMRLARARSRATGCPVAKP